MDKKCGCRFCDIISGIYQYPDIDKPILINEDFYSIASIGSIAEGWTLIVSVRHVLSMKELYGRAGFLEIINQMLPVLIKKYGSLIAFEHGSNYDDSLTGCGINHAHLHVVPFKCSLLGDMFESEYDWVKVRPDEIIDVVGNNEYLFYKDIGLNENWLDDVGYVHVLNGEVSQYFRKMIAKKLGMQYLYDYKKYPYLEVAAKGRKNITEKSFELRKIADYE